MVKPEGLEETELIPSSDDDWNDLCPRTSTDCSWTGSAEFAAAPELSQLLRTDDRHLEVSTCF